MSVVDKIHDALLAGDAKTVVAITEKAIAEGLDPQDLLNKHMIPALTEAGAQFEANELFGPELLLIARAMKGALAVVYSPFDLGCGWEGEECPFCRGVASRDALRLGTSILVYIMTH